jgi:hypothetical protein
VSTNQQAYSSNLVDYHLILDLLPSLARLYLSGQLPATLSYGQVCQFDWRAFLTRVF